MQDQLFPFLFQKARRNLPITVKSDTGLVEGEIWFLEHDEITFWCVEVLRVGQRYEMRADVKTIGKNVDLFVVVEDAMSGRDAAMPGGFLHRGAFHVASEADAQRLLQRFFQLNPEHASSDFQAPAERARAQSTSPEAPERRPPAAPRQAPLHPAGGRRRPAKRPSAHPSSQGLGPSAHRAPAPDPIPPPPLAREHRAAPDFAPGAPPTIMVRYQHREIMQADAFLRGEEFWIYMGRHPLLCEGQEVKLLLQIPAGSVLDLRCTVMAERPDTCVLRARHLHASILANLRAALGG